MAHLINHLWYKVTHLSGGEEQEVHGKYLGLAPNPESEDDVDHHWFEIEGEEEPVAIHPENVLSAFESTPRMPFPR